MIENLHLVFTYPEGISSEFIEEDISQLKDNDLNLYVTRQENSIYAGFEWIVPTFFATYILKPYFESFLQEAGKDHYQLLKDACKKILAKGKVTDVKIITPEQSFQKRSVNYNESIAVSILFQMKTERRIKMLFNSNLDLQDWENALDEFSDIILEHYQNYPNDRLSHEIKDLSPKPHYVIYVKINPITKELEFHDDITLSLEARNSNQK